MQPSSIDEWLASLGLTQYAPNFAGNDVDVTMIGDLTDQFLKDLGVSSVGHRMKILRAAATPAVATPAAPTAELPPAPGETPSSRSVAERRHLTVMFCDLVGSTALAARLDPEDMREVVRAYQGVCAQVIGRYDGFVAQYLGDGIMAYFGYPAAHEDDAERAVRAALDVVAALAKLDARAKVEVRVGIATGLVVVGDLVGEQGAKERAVTGETPNLAARLQGIATPGTVVVSAATRRLLGGMFALRDLGPQSVKGLAEPVAAFAVDGVRSFESRFEARAGGLTGFVGREEEAEHLLERWKLARQGRGQAVIVSGEAGIGKSRLSAWLVERVAAEPHTRMRYQCTPHHKDSALYPTIAQIERAAGIAADDAPEQKLAKLEAVFALAKLDAPEAVPLVASLLAIPTGDTYRPLDMSPGQQRQRTMAAMLDQVEGLARQQPLLMIYEDAHWADATSLELLDALVERIARLPVLLIVTGRPEFRPTWAGRHTVSTLGLQKLDRRDARAMVERVAGGALPLDVLDQIVAKTDGVPLFVEELTKTVLESGALAAEGQSLRTTAALPIPATLQDSLMARLDRSNPVKEIAQIGAAIGREFSYRLLLAVAGMDEATVRAGLAKLDEAELATRRGVPPDATYTFKHALVQDAAYESLLKSRRQVIHRRLAKALRDHFPLLAETEPEIVAHHFTQAGRSSQSVDWWTKAGELAVRRSAYVEATNHFEKAIAIADVLPDDPGRQLARHRLQVAYGNALRASRGLTAPEAAAAFRRCAELGAGLDHMIERLSGVYGIWQGSFAAGEASRALELACSLLRDVGPPATPSETVIQARILGASRWCTGDYDGAIPHLEAAVATYDAGQDAPLATRFGYDVGMGAMSFLAIALWAKGNLSRARFIAEAGITSAIQGGHVQTLAFAHCHKGFLEAISGKTTKLLEHGQITASIGRQHNMPLWVAGGTWQEGLASWRAGARQTGRKMMDEGLRLLESMGTGIFLPLHAALRAKALAEEQPRAMLSDLQRLLDATARSGQRWFDAEIHRYCGQIFVRRCAKDDAAEEAFQEALAVSRAQRTRTFELLASLDLARLYCDIGREREAKPLLAAALRGFEPTPELPEIGEAQSLVASLP